MKFLKGLVLSLLGFLLFLSLSIFGLAFQLNYTILNPKFVVTELDKLEISSLTEEVLSEQVPREEFTEEFRADLINTITKLEPLVKEQVGAATYSIYDYLLGKKQSPDLALTLKNTLLSSGFIVSVVDELDIPALAGEFISKQFTEEVPKEMDFATKYLEDALDNTIIELEPWIKEQIGDAAEPIVDYLLGESQSLRVEIPLEPVKESLKDNLWQALLKSPPPELAHIPQAELKTYYDELYQEFSEQLPPTFEINESLLGTETPGEIATALAEAEWALAQARLYVGYFQLGYKALIGFIVLLILCIILLHHQVRGATRQLGTTFLTYRALEYAGIFAAKYFSGLQLAQIPAIPRALQAWLPQLMGDFLAPLEMLSLGLLIGGVVLLIVSFVYKPREPSF